MFFKKGVCKNGAACYYDHDLNTSTLLVTPAPSGTNSNVQTVPQNEGERAPCSFFQKGTCKNGSTCKYYHAVEESSSNSPPTPANLRSGVICLFYLRNACLKGVDCPFSHTLTDAEATNHTNTAIVVEENNSKQPLDKGLDTYSSNSNHSVRQDSSSRIIGGATVAFMDGAAVSSVSTPSDFSILAVTNLPQDATIDTIREILKNAGINEPIESIVVKLDPQTAKQSAQVKVADGGSANRRFIDPGVGSRTNDYGVKFSTVQLSESDSGTNRLHFSGITCTWHDPSLTAYMKYGSISQAKQSLSRIERRNVEFRGRRPTFVLSSDSRSVKIGNLDIHTTVDDLKRYFKQGPSEITLGPKSHSMSSLGIQRHVKATLGKCGHVIEWSTTVQPGGVKVKAYAKFSSPQEAIEAVKQLNGSAVEPESNDKLYIQRVFSIKLPVSRTVLSVIKPQLDALAEAARIAHYVTVKAYDNPLQAYTQIRVSGSDKASVARVRIQVEKLLAGIVATDGVHHLNHAFLFQASSTSLLNQVMDMYGIAVVRDRKRMLLRLYGEETSIHAAQNNLLERITEINDRTSNIILDSNSLAAAVKGGFRSIVAALGKDKVKLDVTSDPKRIILTGNDEEVVKVQEILRSHQLGLSEGLASMSIAEKEESCCAVCWTPADNPFKTDCGHTYCNSCIVAQSASASEFPVRCLGDLGNCNTPLLLQDLKQVLSATEYEALLETSLTKHIRSHPSSFQYCPTPDCSRFYRVSTPEYPNIFDCDHCLTSVCTSCHSAAHDGQTCKQASIARADANEFAEWKKQNDARDCPSCGTPIQKSAGCNHMECWSCKIHICWYCMKTFKQSKHVYEHMNRDHSGDWGL